MVVVVVGGAARPSVSPVLYKAQQARLVFKRRLYQDLTSPDTLVQKLLYYQVCVAATRPPQQSV